MGTLAGPQQSASVVMGMLAFVYVPNFDLSETVYLFLSTIADLKLRHQLCPKLIRAHRRVIELLQTDPNIFGSARLLS